MTVNDVINVVNEIRPNGFSQALKVSWVSELMAKVKEEVKETHEQEEIEDDYPLYVNYDPIGNVGPITASTTLDVPEAHQDMVENWLICKIDLANADYDRYTNSMVLFNNAYLDYRKWYNRTHMPKGVS